MKHNCVTTYHATEKIILCLCRFEDAEDNQEFEMDDVNSDWCEDEQERDEQTENGAKNIKLHKNVDDEHKDEESNYNGVVMKMVIIMVMMKTKATRMKMSMKTTMMTISQNTSALTHVNHWFLYPHCYWISSTFSLQIASYYLFVTRLTLTQNKYSVLPSLTISKR